MARDALSLAPVCSSTTPAPRQRSITCVTMPCCLRGSVMRASPSPCAIAASLVAGVCRKRRTAPRTPASSGSVPELFVADVDDLVALEAAGGFHLDDLAGFLADER